jgi:uncharacterized protein YdaU (DUF1376 family)
MTTVAPPKERAARESRPSLQVVTEGNDITHAAKAQTERVDIWMPFYLGDFAIDTVSLSTAEVGAYTLLIAAYWRSGGLPNDEVALMRITRLSVRQFRSIWPRLAQFFMADGDRIVSEKLDRERAIWIKKRITYQQRSSKAATERWRPKGDASSIPQALLGQCPSPSPSPLPLPRASLSNDDAPPHHNGRERNTWGGVVEELVERFSVPVEDVQALRGKHSDNIKRLKNGAYPTPENFMRFAEAALTTPSTQQKAKAAQEPLERATKLRKRWWDQWQQETNCYAASSWEGASNTDRSAFMQTKYGDNFVAMAGGSAGSTIDINEFGNIHTQT